MVVWVTSNTYNKYNRMQQHDDISPPPLPSPPSFSSLPFPYLPPLALSMSLIVVLSASVPPPPNHTERGLTFPCTNRNHFVDLYVWMVQQQPDALHMAILCGRMQR